MPRLIRDRYVAFDEVHGCDLVTGRNVRLDEEHPGSEENRTASHGGFIGLASLVEVLDDAQDGQPRWVVADARNGAQAAAMAARAALYGRRRGFIPFSVSLYLRWREALSGDLEERTLLLIGAFARSLADARAALLQAATHSRRPHVLLTFQTTLSSERVTCVREARAAYGVVPATNRPRAVVLTADVARLLERAAHARDFERSGRHAAAERLLRDVIGGLARRQALAPASATLMTLGRLLMERGRALAADKVFDEAADHAHAAGDEALMLDARLWQAAVRTDAARLTDAESVCRAVLLTRALSPGRQRWAMAILARVLLWQGRREEALSCLPAVPDTESLDATAAAGIEATAVRVLVASGDLFQAGQRARALVTKTMTDSDALPRLIAQTAHLRVLAAAGDLELARDALHRIATAVREGKAPLRAARARLIWHDALRRAGRSQEAAAERQRLARIRRAAPALLRRSIDDRLASGAGESQVLTPRPSPVAVASSAAGLLQLMQDEDSDRSALERLAGRLLSDLQATRTDLVSHDAGPISTLITQGSGLATQLGTRTLEAGLAICDQIDRGGYEIGMPVRAGTRLVAALVCRWPLDRRPPPHATELLELAAAVAAPRAEALLASHRAASRASTAVPELIGESAAMQDVRRAIERAARAPFAVLIEGESGVGKELAARAVHQLSVRRERRFCDVNCAALPDELLESELFGHVRGAFTGAVADKPGLFEDADGGTLFLDEVPDLSPRGQAKLLRAVQQQEVRRVGERFSRKVDVRLVTAANRDMRREAAEGRFRADLLYRLDVIRVSIPPLRERPEDIAPLASHFWQLSASRVACGATLAHALLSELARYHWPGNVRELQNVMAALAVAAPSRGRVRPSLLPAAITGSATVTSRRLSDARAQFERRCVEVALARAGNSRTRAAAELGLSRQGLLKTMARLGFQLEP